MTEGGYAKLCRITGVLQALGGLLLFLGFVRFLLTGSSELPLSEPGHYFVAFTGCALAAWGMSLVAASKSPVVAHSMGTPTGVGFGLMALMRYLAATSAAIREWLGWLPLGEAILFTLLAYAFIAKRPSRSIAD